VAAAPGAFLRGFVAHIARYEIHVRGHPPGFVLLLAGFYRLGARGVWPQVVLAVAATGVVAGSVLVTTRLLAGEAFARRVAPFLVVTPAAIWMITSADAVYAAVVAAGVTLVIAALTAGRGRPGLGFAGGLLLGLGLVGSYGMALALLGPALVAVSRRRAGPLVAALLGSAAVLVAFAALGFDWLDGLRATLHEYDVLAIERPYGYFVWADLAAWALALGPAGVAGLARLRGRGPWLVVACGLGPVLCADLIGLSKGEVERIWLPFTVWVTVAAGAVATSTRTTRWWLALQAGAAVLVVSWVTTQW